MPRRPRLNVPGVPLHIIQRGNNRTNCFFTPADYRRYLRDLADLSFEYNCLVHAYALMTNHVHLLLTPFDECGAAPMMKRLGQRHAQYVNHMHGRTGTLFEGRFRSSLVDDEIYVLRCYRYIELNPVRAGLTARPEEYPWSSYRCNADGKPDPIVTPHDAISRLSATGIDAGREAYKALVAEALTDEQIGQIRDAVNGGFALGSARFGAEIASAAGRRSVRGVSGRPFSKRVRPPL